MLIKECGKPRFIYNRLIKPFGFKPTRKRPSLGFCICSGVSMIMGSSCITSGPRQDIKRPRHYDVSRPCKLKVRSDINQHHDSFV
jgi:hypothetical protein